MNFFPGKGGREGVEESINSEEREVIGENVIRQKRGKKLARLVLTVSTRASYS